MENKFTDFYDAWWWLMEHPLFRDPILYDKYNYNPELAKAVSQSFLKALDIDFQKVNPATKMIDDNPFLNTKVECWLECGGAYVEDGHTYFYHDMDLDCGGDTFEEAIVNLANLVAHLYSGEFKDD